MLVTDGFSRFKFCGSPNQAKYLMESRSNKIDITLQTTSQLFGFAYRGFQLYIESKLKKNFQTEIIIFQIKPLEFQ